MTNSFELRNDHATVVVAPDDGGRIASIVVFGHELLVGRESPEAEGHPMRWGAYPMVPFAGRIRRGRFRFDGVDHVLPINLGNHAIHGYGFDRPWRRTDDQEIELEFAEPWPFRGRVRQRFELLEGSLTAFIEVVADEPMPASVGWHPWFRRPVHLDVDPIAMHFRDDDYMATDELVAVPPGPWDDCFCGLRRDPVLDFVDGPRLTLSSDCDHWVVYDEPAHALCVEPQSQPPDALNRPSALVSPDEPLRRWMRYTFEAPRR